MDVHVQCTCTVPVQNEATFPASLYRLLMRTAGSLVMECPAMVAGQEKYAYVSRVKPGSQYDAGVSVTSQVS